MRSALIKKCIPMLVCACFPVTGLAATITTVQPGEWYDPATWMGAWVPGSFDDVILDDDVFQSSSVIVGSINGNGSLTYSGTLSLGNGANSRLTNVAGAGDLNFNGGGDLNLVDATGVNGGINILDGNLTFSMANTVANANSVHISSNSTMNLSGFNQVIRNLDVATPTL